jgi:hypothetical protein
MERSQKRDKISPASNGSPPEQQQLQTTKSSFKPYESCLKNDNNQDAPDDLRVASRIKAHNKPITAAQLHQHMNGNGSTSNHERSESTHSASSQHIRKSPPSTTSPKTHMMSEKLSNSSASKSTTPTTDSPSNLSKSIDQQKEALRNLAAAGAAYPSMPYYNGFPYPYQMELLSQHQSMLKAAALNPYLNYARMKAAASDMMMAAAAGICRDPYCTGCSLGSHFMGGKNGSAASSCPPGCTCDHSTAANKASLANSQAAMAYHAQLAQLAAASQMPYV